MKNIVFILGMLFFFTSCEDFFSSTLEVDPPEHTDQMALHAYIGDRDSLIVISVTRSFGILDNPNGEVRYVDGATIELYKDGNLLFTFDTLPSNERPFNYYKQLNEPLGGIDSEFEIRATHPTLGTAKARQIMPAPVPMVSVQFEEDAGIDEGERVDGVEITFNDPKGVDNFYEFTVYRIHQNGNAFDVYTTTNDPLAEESINYDSWLLSDETFDGKEYQLTLLSYNSFEPGMIVVVNSITEDWYNYSKSVRDQINSEDFDLFAEPVTISTNVDGGLGVFGAKTERVYPIAF